MLAAGGSGTGAQLAWSTTSAAASYRLKRGTSSSGPFAVVASGLTLPSSTDSGLTENGGYYYVVTAVNGAGESAPSPALKLGWGTGLLGTYYSSNNLSGAAVLSRVDPTILFDWGQGSPTAAINPDNFSVRWTGQLEAPETGAYTFTAGGADDYFSMSLNGMTLLKSQTATTNLVAGQKYDIAIEFRENGGAAFFSLFWSTPTLGLQPLPTHRLYPTVALASRGSGGIASANPPGNGNETAASAFDGNIGTKWYGGVNGGTGWLRYQFGSGASWAIREYRLTSGNDVPQRDPAAWEFQGSNEGNTWTTLNTQTAQSFSGRGVTKSYSIANTVAFSQYRLWITANAGGSGFGLQLAELSLHSAAPLAGPAGLNATPGDGQVALAWTPVSGATGYTIKRSAYRGGPYAPVKTVASGTSYTDQGVANGQTYFYVVAAVSSAVEGVNSAERAVTVMPVPLAPSSLAAAPRTSQVALSWSQVPWATAYKVKRATVSAGPFNLLATATIPSFTDSGVTNGTTYHYVVAATNGSGDSLDSAPASATPVPPPVSAAELSSARIAVGEGSVGVTIKASASGRTYQLQSTENLTTGPWVNIGSAKAGTGGDLPFNEVVDPAVKQRFYRVVIGP
jgi:hypothetical protein